MSTRLVVIGRIQSKDADQVALAEGDDVVRAVASDRADHAFGVWILPGRLSGTDDLVNTEVLHRATERGSVDRIAVAVQVLRHEAVAGNASRIWWAVHSSLG